MRDSVNCSKRRRLQQLLAEALTRQPCRQSKRQVGVQGLAPWCSGQCTQTDALLKPVSHWSQMRHLRCYLNKLVRSSLVSQSTGQSPMLIDVVSLGHLAAIEAILPQESTSTPTPGRLGVPGCMLHSRFFTCLVAYVQACFLQDLPCSTAGDAFTWQGGWQQRRRQLSVSHVQMSARVV